MPSFTLSRAYAVGLGGGGRVVESPPPVSRAAASRPPGSRRPRSAERRQRPEIARLRRPRGVTAYHASSSPRQHAQGGARPVQVGAPSCRRPRGRSTRRRAVKGRLVAHVGLKAAGSATPRAPLPLTPRERIDGLLVSTTMFSRPGSLCTYVPAAYWSCWAQRSPGHFGDKRDGTAG